MSDIPTLYGIRACDSVRKARAWLAAHGIVHVFHDYKTQGIGHATLQGWINELGWEAVLNRAGTTFRKLPDADRRELDGSRALALMLSQPSMIKRPVLDLGSRLLVGFKPDLYAAALQG